MYLHFHELLLLFNLSLEELLSQGVFDAEGEAAMLGKTWPAYFHGGCWSIHQVCCSHSPHRHCSLASLAESRYHSAAAHSERALGFFFPPLTTQMKEKENIHPSSSFHFCTSQSWHCWALQKSPSFSSLWIWWGATFFHSTFSSMDTGIEFLMLALKPSGC